MPDYLKPVVTVGYFTGCRRGEILGLKWPQVDLNRRLIRLEASDTKNRTARTIYLGEELYHALAELKAHRDWHRPHCEHVFVREDQPIKSFNKAWHSACKRVGLAGVAVSRPQAVSHQKHDTGGGASGDGHEDFGPQDRLGIPTIRCCF